MFGLASECAVNYGERGNGFIECHHTKPVPAINLINGPPMTYPLPNNVIVFPAGPQGRINPGAGPSQVPDRTRSLGKSHKDG